MKILDITIKDEHGLHALTISQLNALVQKLSCDIMVEKLSTKKDMKQSIHQHSSFENAETNNYQTNNLSVQSTKANLRDLFLMMKLNICYGDKIRIFIDGKDEEQVYIKLHDYFITPPGQLNE